MKRIFNFNDFGQKIYEAEAVTGASSTSVTTAGAATTPGVQPAKPAQAAVSTPAAKPDQTGAASPDTGAGLDKDSLDNVVHFALSSLVSMAKIRKDPYPGFSQDISAIDAANIDDKEKAFLAMADKIKSSPDAGVPGGQEAMDAWHAVAKRAAEGIGEIKDGIKDSPESREVMNRQIDGLIQSYKSSLGNKLKLYSGSTEPAKTEPAKAQNSSYDAHYSISRSINEGIFTTKKGAIEKLKNNAVTSISQYAPRRKDPVYGSAYDGAIDKLTAFSSKLDGFLSKKNREIKQADIDALTAEIEKITTDVGKEESTLVKRSDVYTKASEGIRRLLSELETLRRKADSAVSKYTSEKTQVVSKTQAESKYRIKGNVPYDKTKHGAKNDDVVIFQELAMEKLRPAGAPILRKAYDDLARFGADGKFGPSTLKTVNAFKAGFEMVEDGIITQELIDKMKGTEKLGESERSIYNFYNFDSILENFKVDQFERVWGMSKDQVLSSASKGAGKSSSTSKIENKNFNFLKNEKMEAWKNLGTITTYKSNGVDTLRILWKSQRMGQSVVLSGEKNMLEAKKKHISFFYANGKYRYFKANDKGATEGDFVSEGTWKVKDGKMYLTSSDGREDIW